MPKAEKSEGVTWQNVVDIRDWPERDTGDNETEEQKLTKGTEQHARQGKKVERKSDTSESFI